MPSVLLKNFIMGNLHKPINDHAIADSIDFVSDTVIVVIVQDTVRKITGNLRLGRKSTDKCHI